MLIAEHSLSSIDAQFAEDLCGAFITADIPLYKIRNEKNLFFLEKYRNNTPLKCQQNLQSLYPQYQKLYKNKFLWLSIDETTDATGRHVANIMIGILNTDQNISKQRFLLNTSLLNSINHFSIARLFDETIQVLGEDFNKQIILFIN